MNLHMESGVRARVGGSASPHTLPGGKGMSRHLLRVLEVSPELRIHPLGRLLRVASHRLDVDLQAALQELVHLPVVIVVVAGGERRVRYPQA